MIEVTQAARDAAAQFLCRDDGDFPELAALFQTYGDHVAAAAHATIHQLGENAAKAAERVAVLEGAVERAANVFADYAEMHSAKGTEEGHAKARKNAGLAEELRAALTEPTDG